MKNTFLPLLIIGLLLSVSFGLVMMNHADGQSHGECPFKATGIPDCSRVQNSVGFVTSHLSVLSKFSSAIPVNSFAVSLVLLLALAFGAFITFDRLELLQFKPILARDRLYESFVPHNRILFTHWLALHENSPAFIGRR